MEGKAERGSNRLHRWVAWDKRKEIQQGWMECNNVAPCSTHGEAGYPRDLPSSKGTGDPMKSGSVAIFVKTPGLSPVKTRLGRVIGSRAAEEFYALSVEATHEVSAEAIRRASSASLDLTVYWAIAESAGTFHHMWHQFGNIFQGNGGLGERLSNVYGELLRRHDFVILIGADCPQMPRQYLIDAASFLRDSAIRFVIGPAMDGGFYLFGGNAPLSEELWTRVPYSQSNTSVELMREIRALGDISKLLPLVDVDTIDDLLHLAGEGRDNTGL